MAWTLAQECTLSKFAGNTKLGKVTDTLNGCSAIQSNLDRQEKWSMGTSQSSTEGNANSCTWGGIALSTSMHWVLTSWKATLLKRP